MILKTILLWIVSCPIQAFSDYAWLMGHTVFHHFSFTMSIMFQTTDAIGSCIYRQIIRNKFSLIIDCYDYPRIDDAWLDECCGQLLTAEILDSETLVDRVQNYWIDRLKTGILVWYNHFNDLESTKSADDTNLATDSSTISQTRYNMLLIPLRTPFTQPQSKTQVNDLQKVAVLLCFVFIFRL